MVAGVTAILADLPGILARRGDDDGWAKFIGLAIVAAIWIIGAIATSIQNAKKKRLEMEAAARLSRTATPAPPAVYVPPPAAPMRPMPQPVQYRPAPPPVPVVKRRVERRPEP